MGSALGGLSSAPSEPEGEVLSAVVGRNADLMREAIALWIAPDDVVMDVTYGKGLMWPTKQLPHIKHDLALDGVDLRALPEHDSSVDVVVLDPPYRPGGTPTRMHERYGLDHVDTVSDVLDLYRDGIREAARVLRPSGRLLIKCADSSVNGRLHLMHVEVIGMLATAGLDLSDLFVLTNRERVPTRVGRQRRARRAHSYLLVGMKAS